MSEGHHQEIKELEKILKTEFNEDILEKALQHTAESNAQTPAEQSIDGFSKKDTQGQDMFPTTDQSRLMSEDDDDEDDSLLQLVNEKAQMENVGAALEDFAEENEINRAKFIN